MTDSPEPRNLVTLSTDADAQLQQAKTLVDQLKAAPPVGAAATLAAWNDIAIQLGNAAAASSLMSQVHPDKDVRTQAEALTQEVSKLGTDMGLDPQLYAVFARLAPDATAPDDVDVLQKRLLDKVLRDFRRSGVDKDEATRERLRAISAEQVEVSQEFSRNIREGVRSISVTPDELRGMPQDWLDAHPAGPDGRITVTTDYPDIVPVRMFCEVAATRKAIVQEALTVGWPVNDLLLRRLFNLRLEEATILGYPDWTDFNAETKMVRTGQASKEFIDRIAELARPHAMADKDVLLRRLKQDQSDATDVATPDQTYYAELVRREQYAVSSEEIRQYFDFPAVRQGLLDVTSKLFGLTWIQVHADVWHEDVTAYDVQFEGRRIGRIYLDLHPRDGKFKHAAQFTLADGISGRQLPEGVLVCNFPTGLMQHSDVVTLFHEFGHLIHHVVGGDSPWARFSGVATEWDFVEAPSQLLEEWAWDPTVLATFARDAQGRSIPRELVERMRSAKEFGKGYDACTQMFYAALSYVLHTRSYDVSTESSDELTSILRELQQQYSVFPYLPDTHFHCSFGHLSGYSSGYYTYMWSLVIAKDMFSAFDPADLMNPEIAARYRDTILRPGGTKDAADLVADFLCRPYSFDAYAAWLGSREA